MKNKHASRYETEFILQPGQSKEQYNALKAKWDAKLRANGFRDIETVNEAGQTSFYLQDSTLNRIAASYSPETEEYYRRAGLFLHHYDWTLIADRINPPMGRFIWAHFAHGYSLRETAAQFIPRRSLIGKPGNTKRKPKQSLNLKFVPTIRRLNGPKQGPPSVFWLHGALTNVLKPAFNDWCAREINGVLRLEGNL